MKEPAHKILIDRYLDWDLVKTRLEHYQNIAKLFTLGELQACSNKAPFYCHYLAWRLGTWHDESLFEFLDILIQNAIKLPNWNKVKVPRGCKFEDFWSFLWELQVAQMFLAQKVSVEWTNSGPDLKIISDTSTFFVECTVYRKSFALEEFIKELLSRINPRIKVEHIPFIDYSLPNNAIEPFLNELFQPLLDETFLEEKIKELKNISPIQLPKPKYVEKLYIFLENEEAENIDWEQPWKTTGSPEEYLIKVVKEVLDKKKGANNLQLYKPYLLAVNVSLGRDFQLANALRDLPIPSLIEDFESLYLGVCDIDEIPSLGNRATFFHNNHPIKDILAQ